jgi:hypothetical protein
MGQGGMVYYKPTIPIIVRRVFMATFKKSLWQRVFRKRIVDEVQLVFVYVFPFIPKQTPHMGSVVKNTTY